MVATEFRRVAVIRQRDAPFWLGSFSNGRLIGNYRIIPDFRTTSAHFSTISLYS